MPLFHGGSFSMRFTIVFTITLCCASASASAQTTAAPPAGGDEPGITWRDRPTIDFGNGSRLELRARIQSQFVLRDDHAEAEDPDAQPDRFSFPRSRFGITGELFGRVEFQAEHDMTGDGVWRDLYARSEEHTSELQSRLH